MKPLATIPLVRAEPLSIPFKVHVSADGGRLGVLNTYGMPYAQQLLVIDTDTQEVVARRDFGGEGRRLFNLDLQLSADGATAVMVGGMLKDAAGQDFEPECLLTRVDLASGESRQVPVGPVGFNFVSLAPDGRTAFAIHNGNNEDQVQHYDLRVVDLEAMEVVKTVTLNAPVNNLLYRPREGRAILSLGRDVVSFDLAAHEVGERVCPSFNHPYLLAAFSPEEELIYAAYVASSVVVKAIDVQRRSVVAQHTFSWGWTASTNIVPFGADHLIFPPGSSAGAICLWNRRTGRIDRKAGLPAHLILSTPHPDGRRLYLYDYTAQALQLVEAAPLFSEVREGEA